jgi:tellurite resistance protein
MKKQDAALDHALVALFIAAMNANGTVSPHEAARAHHLIWSTRRFRRKSGEAVGKLIERVRAELGEGEPAAIVADAARAIPVVLRPSAFALVADLLLDDGRIDATERRFLRRLGSDLRLPAEVTRRIIDVMLLKNRL